MLGGARTDGLRRISVCASAFLSCLRYAIFIFSNSYFIGDLSLGMNDFAFHSIIYASSSFASEDLEGEA